MTRRHEAATGCGRGKGLWVDPGAPVRVSIAVRLGREMGGACGRWGCGRGQEMGGTCGWGDGRGMQPPGSPVWAQAQEPEALQDPLPVGAAAFRVSCGAWGRGLQGGSDSAG